MAPDSAAGLLSCADFGAQAETRKCSGCSKQKPISDYIGISLTPPIDLGSEDHRLNRAGAINLPQLYHDQKAAAQGQTNSEE